MRACGFDLEVEPVLGFGVDRSQIRELLALTPDQRVAHLELAALDLLALRRAMLAAKQRRQRHRQGV